MKHFYAVYAYNFLFLKLRKHSFFEKNLGFSYGSLYARKPNSFECSFRRVLFRSLVETVMPNFSIETVTFCATRANVLPVGDFRQQ